MLHITVGFAAVVLWIYGGLVVCAYQNLTIAKVESLNLTCESELYIRDQQFGAHCFFFLQCYRIVFVCICWPIHRERAQCQLHISM